MGDRTISIEDYRQAYMNELRRISQQARREITPEQARMAGIGEKVLGDLVNEAAIDEKLKALKLSVSDDQVVREIQQDDMFQGPTGSFDRSTFQAILSQNNLTENRYLELQRQYTVRRQMTDALMSNVEAPEVFRRAIHAYNTDSRSISFVSLKPEAASAVPAPTADQLKAFYDERKASFAAPEFRKVAVLALDPKAIGETLQIPEAELKAYFDGNQPRYADMEKRSIEQITFPTMDAAKKASDEIKGGKLFEQIMAEQNLKPQDIFLGDMTKAQMFDQKIADVAFSLPQGQVSEPVQGSYANVLLRITGIQQQQLKRFEDVREDIRRVMAEERAKRDVLAQHDKIDEARLGGATLEEAAKTGGLTVRELAAVDSEGNGPDGKPLAQIPLQRQVLETAFRTDQGDVAGTIQDGDAYAWIDVRGVTPPRERPFDEVKTLVESRWRQEEAEKRLDARAKGALEELKKGKALDQVASGLKTSVEQAETTRLGGAPSITAAQAKAIFQTPVEQFGQTPSDEQGGRLVYKVTADNDRPFDPGQPDDSGQIEKISQSIGSDVVTSLVRQLRDQLGARLDPAAIAQVTGRQAG
ncbi:peptidyl-prolyl cis-trans isomerase [Chenggangzhangella methanolivorans]|uniref:peptidyl-prolyl cis-trans isomerase n=1 Tax=Chenggangzhangella methanolivorans TaxID=1437009 RepID=UPI0021BDB040|nr:peptidyl-prolyl cis-trans isomerase [Chenggangzhangella methanolivorans]